MSGAYSGAQKAFLFLGVLITAGMWWVSNAMITELALLGLKSAGQTELVTPTFARVWSAIVATVIVAVPWILFMHIRSDNSPLAAPPNRQCEEDSA